MGGGGGEGGGGRQTNKDRDGERIKITFDAGQKISTGFDHRIKAKTESGKNRGLSIYNDAVLRLSQLQSLNTSTPPFLQCPLR